MSATTVSKGTAGGMVFVSHASHDASVASALVDDLERSGIRCWLAPRDIPLGSDYGSEIVGAIRGASVVLFLLSAQSNDSEHCLRELEITIKNGVPLLSLRLDGTPPSAGVEYRLSTVQETMLDAQASVPEIARRLVELGALSLELGPPAERSTAAGANDFAPRGRPRAERPLLAGRPEERKIIADSLRNVATTRRGRLLMLGGESGVGKSALAGELLDRAESEGFAVCSTTCGSFVETLTFYPVREIIRQLVDSNDLVREVQRIYGVSSIQATMAAVVDSPLATPQARREAIVGTFANIVIGSVDERDAKPLLILIDDMENVDAGSVDSLLCLLTRLDEAPIMVAGVYRSDTIEAQGRSHPLCPLLDAARRDPQHGTILRIGPLRRADYPAVVESILGGRLHASSRLLDHLWAETEGNALFLREIIQAVRAFSADSEQPREARLVLENGEWRFLGTVDALPTPRSVEEAIAQNLDGIGADDRGYLELAAVIGKQFGFDIALGISGTDENELLDSLENSIGRSIIRELIEPADSFEFSHSKIREVLYNSLSKVRRRRIHSKIADLLADSGDYRQSSDRDSLIGEHLYLAGRYAQAADFLIRSADRLLALSDSRRAAIVYERVLISLDKSRQGDAVEADDLRVAHAKLGRIEAMAQASEYDEAKLLCAEVIDSSADDHAKGWAYDHLGDIEWASGAVPSALAAYQAAEEIASRSGAWDLELEVCADLAELHDRQAEHLAGVDPTTSAEHRRIAEGYLDRQYALGVKSTDARARARAFRNNAKRLRRAGDMAGALREFEVSLDQTDASVATHSVLISYAKTLTLNGDKQKARDVITRVLNWSQQTGARRSRAIALHYRAMLTIDLEGATERAFDDLDNALTLHEEIGYRRGQWEVRMLRGEWLVLHGRKTEAVAEFRAAVDDTSQLSDDDVVAAIARTLDAIDENSRATTLREQWNTP